MIKTENFNPKTDKKLICTCGHPECDQRSVNQETLFKVQFIREDIGRPLRITSGGRCQHHPDEVKKKRPGDHFNRVAVDIAAASGTERMELVRLGLKHGATAIGVAKTFVHLGWRDTKHHIMWTY